MRIRRRDQKTIVFDKQVVLFAIQIPLRRQGRHPWSSCLHRVRSCRPMIISTRYGKCKGDRRTACTASVLAASYTCTPCILTAAQPSWSSSPSCGRRASSDHRNRTAYGRNDAFPGRIGRPEDHVRGYFGEVLLLMCIPCRPCTASPCAAYTLINIAI